MLFNRNRQMVQGARPALSVMVGQQYGMQRSMVGQCAPPANFYPPGCSPTQQSFDQAAYNAMCQARNAEAESARISILRANQPQLGLGINNRDDSTAGTIIAGGSSRTMTVTSVVPICLTKLFVSRGSTAFFTITSLQAALQEYLVNGSGIPADMFAPDSLASPIQLPYLMPGTELSLTVTNTTSEDHDFYAGFQGIADRAFTGPCN